MKSRVMIAIGCLGLLLLASCSGTKESGYLPPDLASAAQRLTIGDRPLGDGKSAQGDFPADGRLIGYLFEASAGEVLDIVLARTSGSDVPALAVYQYQDGSWSQPLVWATADASEIGVRGWTVPASASFLALIDVVSGDRTGTFTLTIGCDGGCQDDLPCNMDADCAAGEICWEGLCVPENIQCRENTQCPAGQICERGICREICTPAPEVCDGMDNDCDGVIDEDCNQQPCGSDRECAAGEVCVEGRCVPNCGCAADTDCPVGTLCVRCQCVQDSCAADQDGDGFGECTGDCDDQNAAVNPRAPETCDNLDNDCDGVVDEGCGSDQCGADRECPAGEICWDGVCVIRCASDADCPAGQICDARTGICAGQCQPGREICDGRDNDCDGMVDEDFDFRADPANCGGCGITCAPDAPCTGGRCTVDGCTTDADCPRGQACVDRQCVQNCTDQDGDGFCGDLDCDDTDASVHPGAVELCDGRDNDCNGIVDDGCTEYCRLASDCQQGMLCCNGLCSDPQSDPASCGACGAACGRDESCVNGACVAIPGCRSDIDCAQGEVCIDGTCRAGCVDQDGDGFCAEEDCDDADASVNPGATDLCSDGRDNDCDGLVDEDCGQQCNYDADCDDRNPDTVDLCVNGLCTHR